MANYTAGPNGTALYSGLYSLTFSSYLNATTALSSSPSSSTESSTWLTEAYHNATAGGLLLLDWSGADLEADSLHFLNASAGADASPLTANCSDPTGATAPSAASPAGAPCWPPGAGGGADAGQGAGAGGGGRRYWSLVLVLFPLLTLFGNVLVILAVFREKSLQTVTNCFIVSLALADLLVAVLVMPFAVYVLVNGTWGLPGFVCDFYIAMDVTCSTSSIFNLVAISIDRYIAVTQPIKYAKHRNSRRVWLTIALVWVISAAIGSPIVLGLNNTPDRQPDLCLFYNSDFIIYSSLSSFYIPCIIMVFLYYNIFMALRNRARKAKAARRPLPADIKPGSVIENLAQTRRLAETALGPPHLLGPGGAPTTTDDEERPTNTGSGSQEDDDYKDVSPGSEDCCHVIPNDRSAEFILATVAEETGVTGVLSNSAAGDGGHHGGRPRGRGGGGGGGGGAEAAEAAGAAPEANGNHDSGYAASTQDEATTTTTTTTSGTASSQVHESSPRPKVRRNDSSSSSTTGPTVAAAGAACSPVGAGPGSPPGGGASASASAPRSPPAAAAATAAPGAAPPPVTRQATVDSLLPSAGGSKREKPGQAAGARFTIYKVNRASRKKRDKSSARKERKATKTLAIVLGVFLVCWVPFFTCNIMDAICTKLSGDCSPGVTAFILTTWLGYMNSFVNPVIYTIFNPEFRKAFKKIMAIDT